jgi:carbon-monoxide dehydrogenase large subunit
MSLLGNRVARTEDPKFLTVGGHYVGDLRIPDAAAVAFTRSIMAHARLTGVDTSAAAAMPGVLGVFTAADIADLPKAPSMFPGMVQPQWLRPLLATDRVRFVGEAIAVVVAETPYQAADAATEVVVDYDPLPAVIDMDDAARDEVILFDEPGTNICSAMPNLLQANFDDCEVVVTHRVANQRVAPAPMEPRAYGAEWDGDRMIVHASCQGAHQVRGQYEQLYGLPPEQIRVVTPDVGGGFGAKGFPHVEELLLPELARRVGRPVIWAETRTENLLGMVHGRGQRQTVRVGGTRDGLITAYELDILQDAGAYPNIGSVLPGAGFLMLTGTYGITNVGFNSRSVVTNTTPVGAYRGAGRPEATAAIERAVDLFAAEIGMDPADVRAKNLLPDFADGHTTPSGTRYDSGRYNAALQRALEAADYQAVRADQEARRERGDRRLLGIGVSTYVEVTAMGGGGGISEYGSVELRPDGSLLAKTGSTPHGQGHVTTWQMLISDETDVPMDRIEVVFGDTDVIPHSNVTGGSRSVQIAGSSMVDASQRLVDLAREHAANVLEAKVDDVVLDRDTGQFHVAGTPARAVSWAEVGRTAAGAAAAGGETLVGLSQFAQAAPSFPFGAHVAVVEVDTETGRVDLVRHVAVDDCGRLVNPLLVDGQVHGGLAQGAAQALIEEVRYDEDGNPLTSNFADYGIISMTELPSFERVEMVTRTPLNALGAKGIGEAGTIGSTPAVHNAVVDALAHFGVRHVDMPCTPEKVWRAINSASAAVPA